MSSCGSVIYGVTKELAKILKPLVGKSPNHINSTQDFVEQAKHITLVPGECLSSYDVSALFTSVPVDPALNIIKDLLEKDHTLKERTIMEVSDIILLLEFCLKNTYFSFQDQFYEKVEGAAMGSPVSPIVANLYMQYLEQKALSTAPNPPRFWCRFVDDTFVIHKEANKPPGFPQGQRPYGKPKWCHILVPMWWPRLWWGIHWGNLQDLWWKIQRVTWRLPQLFMIIAAKQATPLTMITSK